MPESDPRSLVRSARALLQSNGADHPHHRGLEQAARGNFRDAIASFRAAVASAPDAPWSFVALGDVLMEVGERAEAAVAYRGALQCSPANAIALRESIATGLSRAGDEELAIGTFRALLAREPGRPIATAGLVRALLARSDQLRTEAAELLVDAGDLTGDEPLIEAALSAAPQTSGLYRLLARSLSRRGECARALTVIQVALAHDPDDRANVVLLAELLAGGVDLPPEQRDRLMALVERGVHARPDDRDLLVNRARMVTRYGSARDAVEAWRAVVACEPDVALWHRELGDRLAAVGDFEAAGAAYDHAVALGYDVY